MSKNRRFTKDEDAYIRKHYRKMAFRDIADHLGRSTISINHRVQNLGLTKKVLRRWTPAEDQFIRDNHDKSVGWIAQKLDRDRNVVSARAKYLGLNFRRAAEVRLQKEYLCVRRRQDGRRITIWQDVEVMERHLGRKLRKPECIYHINLSKTDNRIENLYLCRDRSHHKLVHSSLEGLIPDLLKRSVIRFNRDLGIYELCEASS
jgi:hypothetical protein